MLNYSFTHSNHTIFCLRKSKILTDTNQYPDNKLTEQQTSEGSGGEKSDETCEKYVIEKPEGVKDEYDEDGDKRDDSEKVKCADKKNGIEKLPPGWERHEGQYLLACY